MDLDSAGNSTKYDYDESKNLKQITYSDGASVSYEYDPKINQPIKKTDEAGRVTVYEYDASANRTKTIEAYGTAEQRVTEYQYNSNGEVIKEIKVIGEERIETSMEYNENGDMNKIIDSMGGVTEMTFDYMGNMLRSGRMFMMFLVNFGKQLTL
jgi:YD repeat-containing protein